MGIGGLGMWEILLIFMVVLLLFGAKRLPEIGSSLGKGIREFKGSIREIEHEIKAPEPTRRTLHAPPTGGPGAVSERSKQEEGASHTTPPQPGSPAAEGSDSRPAQ